LAGAGTRLALTSEKARSEFIVVPILLGEAWKFLKLSNGVVELDSRRFYVDNPAGISGALSAVVNAVERIP